MARVVLGRGSQSGATGGDLNCFFTEGGPRDIIFRSEIQATRTYCGRSLFSPQLDWFEYPMPGYGSWRDEHISGSVMELGV